MTRRETILEAALESLEDGEEITVEGVRERSGISVGWIHRHFGDRDALLGALYAQILDGFQDGILRTLKTAADAESGIKELVRYHLRWVERNPERARFLLDGGVVRERAGGEVEALNRVLFAAIDDWVESHGEIAPTPREAFFAAVFGPAQALSRSWLVHRTGSLRQVEDDLADTAWRAVRSG